MVDLHVYGLLGFIVLAMDLYAIIRIVGSNAGAGPKTLWVLLILMLPVVGLLVWALFGPERPAIA
jgi:hypothetical protein